LIVDAVKGDSLTTALLIAPYGGTSGKKWAFLADSPDSGMKYPHWSVRGLAPRIWTSYLAKLREHNPFIQVGSGWAKTSAHARIPSGFYLTEPSSEP
jgi:hypothetical protein